MNSDLFFRKSRKGGHCIAREKYFRRDGWYLQSYEIFFALLLMFKLRIFQFIMSNIIFIWIPGVVEDTVFQILANKLWYQKISVDENIEYLFLFQYDKKLFCGEIIEQYGEDFFRKMEIWCLKDVIQKNNDNCILDLRGHALTIKSGLYAMRKFGKIIWPHLDKEINYQRILERGISSIFGDLDNQRISFGRIVLPNDFLYLKSIRMKLFIYVMKYLFRF